MAQRMNFEEKGKFLLDQKGRKGGQKEYSGNYVI